MSRGVTDYVEHERDHPAVPEARDDPGAPATGPPDQPTSDQGPGARNPLAPAPARPGNRGLWTGAAQAAALWGATRLALIGFVLLLSWIEGLDQVARTRDWLQWALDRFWGRDAGHFSRIADVGYPPGTCCDQAFLPGYPLATRALSVLTGGDLRLAALLVTAVAGMAAASVLWLLVVDRIGARDPADARPGGFRAVLYLIVAPYGVFLTVGYSEAIFLAVALAAWLAASRRLWWVAGLMAAAAVSIRINGLFLLAALALMYLLQLRADRRWRPRADALALLFPVAPLAGIAVWLHHSTGSWNAWQEAEAKGWGRQTAWPWQGLADGWHEITVQHGPHILIASLAAFATVVFGLLLIPVLGWLRRWPEMLFMVLNVLVLVCSTTFVSAPRYGLTWFPAVILAAELTGRARLRWLHPVLLIACLPLEATLFLLYARHFWVA